jgi:putative ABC transport system permease protein
MTWRDTFWTAMDAVRSHRLRSSLTMLGILIGITAVVLTVGIGQGAQATVRDQINELGTNLLVVSPGSSTSSTGVRGGFGTVTTLTQADAAALTSNVAAPDVEAISPVSTTSAELVNASTGANWTTTLTGTTPNWQTTRSRGAVLGRFISAADQRNAAPVVVLGGVTVTQLFGSTDPLGSSVTYNGVKLQVIGVLQNLSSAEQAASNDLAIVPISTYAQRLVGGVSRNSVSSIYVKATSAGTLSAAYQETNALLLNTHHVATASSADFSIATQQSILAASNTVDNTLTVMLAGIAVISLLVGGIGVMNIMLVSVTERIREIGVRKAIGASPSDIRRQFLVEASVLGLAGGLLGVAVGILGAVLIPQFSDQRVILSIPASIGAIVIAIGIGVVFGVYPASRAARLAPIDALRSE